jgi:hypothetical protein
MPMQTPLILAEEGLLSPAPPLSLVAASVACLRRGFASCRLCWTLPPTQGLRGNGPAAAAAVLHAAAAASTVISKRIENQW